MDELSKKLIAAVKNDLTPSLGVTEPGAIAYAAAAAARALGSRVQSVKARLNSGIYKNSFTCAVPGTDGMGCALAAALGAVCGDPDKKLTSTEGAASADIAEAKRLVSSGRAAAELEGISPDIYIEAEVVTGNGTAKAVIRGRHDRIVSLNVNGVETIKERSIAQRAADIFKVSSATFDEILDCVETAEDIGFVLEAVEMNTALFREGKRAGLMPLTEARHMGYSPANATVTSLADLHTAGAIEARVRGANAPAMAITGSGSHGILCTLPVYEAGTYYGDTDPARLERALLLSMLITTYIKENSGLLSTACGCVLAGGTGAALGVTYLLSRAESRDELKARLTRALSSMAASVTGMICHGGNTGCSLKASVGVNMAFAAAKMALNGAGAERIHGIIGMTPEDTMKNMGRIACGMLPLESTIIDIMSCKAGFILL